MLHRNKDVFTWASWNGCHLKLYFLPQYPSVSSTHHHLSSPHPPLQPSRVYGLQGLQVRVVHGPTGPSRASRISGKTLQRRRWTKLLHHAVLSAPLPKKRNTCRTQKENCLKTENAIHAVLVAQEPQSLVSLAFKYLFFMRSLRKRYSRNIFQKDVFAMTKVHFSFVTKHISYILSIKKKYFIM